MQSTQKELTRLYNSISSVILGKKDAVVLAIATCLCRGHLLIQDVPGTGKTVLARALAGSVDARFTRLQCTPDMLPTDITGVSVFNRKTAEFDFMPGPVFTNILLADEINRTTPRAQSALLECMAEAQVTVEGRTRPLDQPFMVIATQNPVEFSGTYPLPEAQLDRFFMRISLGYPALEDEIAIMEAQRTSHPVDRVRPVIRPEDLIALQEAVPEVTVTPDVQRYIAQVVRATRTHPDLELGASPRGTLALTRAAQAVAMIAGRDYVDPAMVKRVAVPVLAHRLVPRTGAREAVAAEQVMRRILEQVRVPVAA